MTRQIQDGIGVATPNPPQTPPTHRSLDDLRVFFKFSQVFMCSG